MELTSAAFADGAAIPPRHTCDGEDVSPPLAWTAPPRGTVAVALCVDDPDAGRYPFTHWVAWGLAPTAGELAEGEIAPAEGRNDFGAPGYRGPCPPPGKPHRYVLRLYALAAEPALTAADRRRSFDAAIDGHVLATAELLPAFTPAEIVAPLDRPTSQWGEGERHLKRLGVFVAAGAGAPPAC